MKYTLDEIETFLAVMELGTITAVAARLNLSKSVISKRISDLETTLGAALFRRNAGRISPTEAAQRLDDRLRPALAELTAAAESAAWGGAGDDVLRGTLSIAAPMSFGTLHLSPIIARFAAQHPKLEMRIDYDDRARDLFRDGFDLAVRIGNLRDTALMQRKLCEDETIPCASPAYLDRYGRPETLDHLGDHQVIGYQHMSNAQLWTFDNSTPPALHSRLTLNNGEAMRDMAIEGLGVAILPAFLAMAPIRKGKLERILPNAQTRNLPIVAVWPPVSPMPQKLRQFIDYLIAELEHGKPWTAV
ncbi:HTH-type transcriptional regulator DmlR [Sulfitobacter indolifex]|uniref:Transcriptional regulator n=1 Tax=Sulfitobacter indolifex HEL-45 TaxID=391624 RepID=A0ABM9X5S3_9RHOB|nr:LysR family transcriptional regulator [Sulfitobacter indolifex]EDQ04840.1 putative transcriptional regulator [Sulfitobacter indolifex HEL-45]UOA18932.1 HTH-type transcriptional regulator DmlR [Sulfitobacter indolifex]